MYNPIFKKIDNKGDNEMYATITGFIKQELIVDINGNSVGENPHYVLQILQPINKEIYLSDSKSDLYNDILTVLCENNMIPDKNFDIHLNCGMIELYKKFLICE